MLNSSRHLYVLTYVSGPETINALDKSYGTYQTESGHAGKRSSGQFCVLCILLRYIDILTQEAFWPRRSSRTHAFTRSLLFRWPNLKEDGDRKANNVSTWKAFLYDKKNNDYKNRGKVAEAWLEIAREMGNENGT